MHSCGCRLRCCDGHAATRKRDEAARKERRDRDKMRKASAALRLHPCYVPLYRSASSVLTPRRNRRRGKKESVAWEGSFFVSLQQSRPPCTILPFS
ncbi:hypothetical protein WN51_07311 [Melipona quadrifasciata]|uniref:Uncharacterized protein n=1 Tax=Melipona quadrifasciata TaxID=166423 RepID=A0A0N0BCD0_9HYME|nr:hypothetical protein WN51_07311 [Melipona quadrifasciata]